jgi:hypothetical protein
LDESAHLVQITPMEFHPAMAQLAHCPSCKNQIVLPDAADESDARDQWVQCPECEQEFAVAEASLQVVKQARLVERPSASAMDRLAEQMESETSSGDRVAEKPKPKFGGATLASFLGDDEASSAPDDKSDARTPAEFESLDDLIRRGPSDLANHDPPRATIEQAETDAVAASGDQNDAAGQTHDEEEPSPADDRLRPTFSELYRGDPTAADEVDDSGNYDPVEDVVVDEEESKVIDTDPSPSSHDFSITSTYEPTLRDDGDLDDTEVAASVPDAPSFDFEVGDPQTGDTPKSLRAAMGFSGAEPLEVEEPGDRPDFGAVDTHDDEDVAPELNVDADAPRGKVAARKRSGVLSFVRTLVGVAGGGVVGIVGGYLLLLWILHFIGRTDEPLALAQYYPDVVKPSTFQDAAPAAPIFAESDNLAANDPPPDEQLNPIDDSGVETANFEADVASPDDGPEPWDVQVQPTPLVMGAPSYTAAELQELTGMAQEVAPDLTAAGPIDKVKGSSYARLAKLAESLTFAEGASDVSWKTNARDVFPQLFASDPQREQVATIAEFWRVSPKRGHGGIFFSGAPDAGRQQGSVAEYTFTLPTDRGEQFTVLTPRALPVDTVESDSVVVVGAVIDDPASRIEGYTGDAKQAIWSTNIFPSAE